MEKLPDGRPVIRNVLWGIRWGLSFAVGITLLAAIPALIRAFMPPTEGWKTGISFPALVGIYLAGGIVAGALVGLLRGWTRSWLVRRGLGILIGMVLVPPIGYAFVELPDELRDALILLLSSGAVWGFCMSFIFEDAFSPVCRGAAGAGGERGARIPIGRCSPRLDFLRARRSLRPCRVGLIQVR